jgi:chemotaxis signal transduction protein
MPAILMGPPAGWYMVFTLNRQKFALNSENLLELVKSGGGKLTKVPNGRPFLAGMTNHRGHVLPVFDLRTVLGFPSFQQEIADMEAFLHARESDHVAWLDDLRASVETGREFNKSLDPKLCDFGKWYEALRSDRAQRTAITDGNLYLEKILDEFDEPHKRIHGTAARVLELAKAGRKDEAMAIVHAAWEKDLALMKNLFKRFFEAFAGLRVPLTVVMALDGVQFACLVDRADYVGFVQESEFQAAPEITQGKIPLARFSLDFNGETALLLELEQIVQTVVGRPLAA